MDFVIISYYVENEVCHIRYVFAVDQAICPRLLFVKLFCKQYKNSCKEEMLHAAASYYQTGYVTDLSAFLEPATNLYIFFSRYDPTLYLRKMTRRFLP